MITKIRKDYAADIAFLKGPLEGVKWLKSTHLPYFCVNDKGVLLDQKNLTALYPFKFLIGEP
ncbi:MAG: hypothetical protein K2W92_03865 [Alphaproteobacteria bacterium]|nr:hypothetical protein [Alphaproteobacteria bacterium]